MNTSDLGFVNLAFTSRNPQTPVITSAYEAAYTCLRQGLYSSRGLLLLTGAAGVGKTTLLHHLTRELAGRARSIFVWNTHQSFDDLLDYICDCLEFDVYGKGQAGKMKALEAHLSSLITDGHAVFLVVDDAQRLPEATLEGLGHLACLQVAGRPLLQMVLSGDPSLDTRLRKEPALKPLAQNMDRHCQLAPLKDQEVIRYIRERLKAAGYERQNPFREDALERVVAYAQGLPRLINLICSQALFLAAFDAEPCVHAALIDAVAADVKLPERSPTTSPVPISGFAAPATAWSDPITVIARDAKREPQLARVLETDLATIPLEPNSGPRRPHRRYHRWRTLSLSLLAVGALSLAFHNLLWEQIDRFLAKLGEIELSLESPQPPEQIVPRLRVDELITARVQVLLDEARQRMKSLDYVLPKGESALDSYREVLRLDPGNREALQGIARMKASFLEWSNLAQVRGDFARAQEYLQIILTIDPSDSIARARLTEIVRNQIHEPVRRSK
jgi:general secretion pathway protein A